jgi:hypothetical protein
MKLSSEEIKEKLANGCSETEFRAMRCPVCGEPLVLEVHPTRSMLTVRCTRKGLHIRWQIEPKVRPEWLDAYVGGAWTKDWKIAEPGK